jgi:antitoxin VapB
MIAVMKRSKPRRKRRQLEQRAKLFRVGRDQAVRLPRGVRFDGDSVLIRRSGKKIILAPIPDENWPEGFFEWLDSKPFGDDFEVPARPKAQQKRNLKL